MALAGRQATLPAESTALCAHMCPLFLISPLPCRPSPCCSTKVQDLEGKLRTAVQDKNNFQLVRWLYGCGREAGRGRLYRGW